MSRIHALLLCMSAGLVGALLGFHAGSGSQWKATAEHAEGEQTALPGHLQQSTPKLADSSSAPGAAASPAQLAEQDTWSRQSEFDLPRDLGAAMDAEDVRWQDSETQVVNIGPELDVDHTDG